MSDTIAEEMWNILDSRAAGETEFPAPYRDEHHNDQVVAFIKWMVFQDPEGAARRASGQPQYDRERGTEHEPVPDGGGDSGKPHPSDFALAAPAALADCE